MNAQIDSLIDSWGCWRDAQTTDEDKWLVDRVFSEHYLHLLFRVMVHLTQE